VSGGERMPVPEAKVIRIDYPKHWFVIGTIFWAAATTVLFYMAWIATEDITRNFWLAAGVIEGILVFLFFVPPLFTNPTAGQKALRLRMGLLIDAAIPYAWIKGVKETAVNWGGIRVGVGVRYNGITRTLFATTEFSILLSLKLDSSHLIGRLLKRQVQEVVLSVKSTAMLADLLRERIGQQEEV